MSGFIAMSRRAFEHPLLRDADHFHAWFWLVAHAAWRPTRTKIKGKMVNLERGELSFSQRFLAQKWGWSKSRVDRFIAELRDHEMVEIRTKERGNSGATTGATAGHPAGQGASIISICNYEKYQDPLKAERGNGVSKSGASASAKRGEEEQGNKIIPLPNGNGADDFWKFAVGYLGESKRSLIGRWCRDFGGQPPVARAITDAQFAHAVEPIAYIEKALRLQRADAEEVPIV
jgi:hypothetical protein